MSEKNIDDLNRNFDYPAWGHVRFVESKYLTVQAGWRKVRRTWKERLLTRPWRPWQHHKLVAVQEPDPQIYEISPGVFIGHPVTITKLRQAVSP